MILLIVFLLFITSFMCYLHYRIDLSPDAQLFNKVPGPKKLPIIGNFFHLFLSPVEIFYMARQSAKEYKDLYGVQVVHYKVVNIYNPDDVETILSSSKHITKSNVYTFLHPWLNQGLLTSKGDKWHQRRKILTPAFHFNILRQFCKIFDEQSLNLIELIKSNDNQVIDVVPVITHFAMNSICETAMGIQLKKSNSGIDQYKDAIIRFNKCLMQRMIKFWLHPDQIFEMTPTYKKQQESLSILHNFTNSVINQRRKERESSDGVKIINNEDIENDVYMRSNKKRLAMLDLLLAAEADGKIDEAGIREEVDTFMFGGHDTSTMTLCFALMTLANHRDVQEKIYQESNEIFGESEKQPTIEDLHKMKYLEMCIKEILRLYPIGPFISRYLDEAVTLSGYEVPAGTICHIHIFDLHRNPNIYEDPNKFDPERFSSDNPVKRHPFAYVPFSAGPRNCIGQKFAMCEIKTVLSTIIRNFILKPITKPDDLIFTADMVLRCTNPILVKFVPRN